MEAADESGATPGEETQIETGDVAGDVNVGDGAGSEAPADPAEDGAADDGGASEPEEG